MPKPIPDLWRRKEDAERLYQLYLCRLWMNRLHERAICACRRIRRYAACGPGAREGLFTFYFEIDSLCELKDYKTAWRQLRLRERFLFGERLDLARRQWSRGDESELVFSYAPLLFFLGRYRLGCTLLETALGFCFNRRKVRSCDFLWRVYNGYEQPRDRYGVTLAHFYGRLGKDLRQWQHWEAFVKGLHPRLFRLSRVRREDLLPNAGHLALFLERLRGVVAERAASGVGGGLADLLDTAATVRKRQEATRRQRDEFNEWIKPVQERTNRKLEELFPELQGLPR